MTEPTRCSLYRHETPSLVLENHHVVPLSWWVAAKKTVDTPFRQLCPTCHMNVHWWIDKIIATPAGRLALPPLIPFRAYRLAVTGIELGLAAGLTPWRTL